MLLTIMTDARFNAKTGKRLKSKSTAIKKYRHALKTTGIEFTEEVFCGIDGVPNSVWAALGDNLKDGIFNNNQQRSRNKMAEKALLQDFFHVFKSKKIKGDTMSSTTIKGDI